ncbi:hypothetical protein MyNCGM683_21590 [Achromobacter xylosoxidans]
MSGPARKVLGLALACVILFPGAWASPALQGREIIDVFPAQSWASLGVANTEPVKPTTEVAAQADAAAQAPAVPVSLKPVPPPFEVVGEWREAGALVFVLDGGERTFILCDSACAIRGAIHPGEEIADGYRLKNLSSAGLTIVANDGRSHDLHALELKP